MKAPEFFINNYVGNYEITTFYNRPDKFIIANTQITSRQLSSHSAKYSYSSLAIIFANLNLDSDKEILDFCNTYGLPFSSQKCLDLRKEIDSQDNSVSLLFDNLFLNEILEDKDYIKYDNTTRLDSELEYWQKDISEDDIMPLVLFKRCVKLVRCILAIHNWLIKEEGSKSSIIHNLAYLLFFAYRGTQYLSVQSYSPTISISKRISQSSNIDSVFKPTDNDTYTRQIKDFIDSLDSKTLKNINDYDRDILNFKGFNSIIELETTASAKINNNFARKIIYDIINDNISMATSKISIISNSPIAEWHTVYLMNAIYLDLYYSIIYADTYKKCRNPQCGKYFVTNGRRSDAVYCSNKCASKMGKLGKYVRICKT